MSSTVSEQVEEQARALARTRGAHAWQRDLIDGRPVRTGNPLVKAGELFSIRAGMEFLNVIPPVPEVALLNLVSRYTVGDDVQMIQALMEADRATGAGVVAEGAVKPVLVGGVGGASVTLDTFAALLTLPRNQLADRPYLEGLISNLLRQALALSAWQALLAVAFTNADVPEYAGTIRDGQMRVEHGCVPNAVALHPDDWQAIEEALPGKLAPVQQFAPGIWLPMYGPLWVVSSGLMAQGKALVGDFRGLALVMQATADLSSSDSDQASFTENRVTVRLEQQGKAMVAAPHRLYRVLLSAPGGAAAHEHTASGRYLEA